ncbi:GtrA family protein [Paracoccus tegillarcae]|nr:GtrA family protein [Paracoccus tegillarcae]
MPQLKMEKAAALFWLAFRFGLVGLGSVGVYFIALYLLRPLLDSTIALTAAAYVISAVFNFILQNFFTFRGGAVHSAKVVKYMLMHILCMTINSSAMYLLVDIAGQKLYLSQLITTGIVAIVSFVLSSRYVYRDRSV